jgi:Big-like domain-containing protein
MKNKLRVVLFSLSLALLLSACGGGDNSGGTANHAPALSAISDVSMVAGNSVTIALTATDQDNDTVVYSVSGGTPSTVSATISGNSLTITPAPGYTTTLPITFTATASDGKGGTDAKTFSVSVTAPTKVVVKLATTGTLLQGSSIGAIDVTLKYSTDKGLTISSENVVTSGVASNSFMFPNLSVIGEIRSGNITGSGFGVGEFETLTFTIAPGNSPLTSDFTVVPGTTVIFSSDAVTTDLSGQLSVIIQSVTFQ